MAAAKAKADTEKANNELIASLKFKVKELETEVSTLRGRLDDLRKAKNTTITKREREVVEVGFKRDPRYEAKIAELERKHKETIDAKNKEIEELKKKHAADLENALKEKKNMEKELDELRKKLAAEIKEMEERLAKESQAKKCNHEGDLTKMRARIAELEGDNGALRVENADLNERVSSLVTDLSIKEAKWCEMEEQYKLKLKQGWGEKYAEWMQETERKLAELQEANNILRTYLHRSGTQIPPEAGGT